MPFNGSGQYTLPAGNPVVTGTTISSTTQNNTMSDVATALSTTITKDGQTTPTANIPMGGFKLTGLGAATVAGDALRFENIALIGSSIQNQTYVAFTTGGTSTAYTLTPIPAITAYTAGQSFFVKFDAASGNAPTLAISAVATPPNLVKQNSDGTYSNIAANDIPINHRSRITLLSATQAWIETLPPVSTVLRSYLAGCGLSTAGASATMSIAAGSATDSTNVYMMQLAAIAKTTSAWAVGTGNGGLDTGAIANNTWYHFFVIRRTDTGVVDVLISLSATAPTMPTNYTQFRRIGSGRTNGSAQWTSFIQFGDKFNWLAPVNDVNAVNPGTAAVTRTLTVPTGLQIEAYVQLITQNTGSAGGVTTYLSDLAGTDSAPANSLTDAGNVINSGGAGTNISSRLFVRTNTSAQIRSRIGFSDASVTLLISTVGWVDTRGKDS